MSTELFSYPIPMENRPDILEKYDTELEANIYYNVPCSKCGTKFTFGIRDRLMCCMTHDSMLECFINDCLDAALCQDCTMEAVKEAFLEALEKEGENI